MTHQDLIALVESHQSLLSGDRIIAAVESVPMELRSTLEHRFLAAVGYYHLQHKADQKDWAGSYALFCGLMDKESQSPLLAFYIPNYAFLAGRNANQDGADLAGLFLRAKSAAEGMQDPLRSQLLGFALYNWARYLLKTKNTFAMNHYNLAGEARLRFYRALQASGTADEATLKAAATQVWKIHEDWATFFPDKPIEMCVVSAELHAELAPLADPAFSAKKN